MKKSVLIIITALVVGVGVYFATNDEVSSKLSLLENPAWVLPTVATTTIASPDLPEAISNAGDPPPDYVPYVNEKYGFTYHHSPLAKITEYDEGGGAMTVVQENEQTVRGLQIFIVPYTKDIITEERFHRDIPSGVKYNIANTTVGKKEIPAVTFNSYDEFLGETREVWFIYDGHLYEITTFKGFADWFAPIMQTWRFI